MPDDLAPTVNRLIEAIATRLDEGKELPPSWFLIHRELRTVLPLVIPFNSAQEKYAAADKVRAMAYKMQCDCVIFVCEGWGLAHASPERYEQILASGGQIRDQPDAVDVILLNIETHDSLWMAQPKVTVRGKRRLLGPIEYMAGPELHALGAMQHYLPPKPGTTVQ
jgi:hypothetical protein